MSKSFGLEFSCFSDNNPVSLLTLVSTIVRDRRYLTIAWAPCVGPALLVVSAEERSVSDLLTRKWSEATSGRGTYRSNEVPSLPVSFAKLIRRGPPLIMLP